MVWLKEVDSVAIQSSLKNLADSYTHFFKKQNKALRFKSKKNKIQSYTTKHTNGNVAIINSRIKFPKLGVVKFAKSREVNGRVLNAAIRRNPSGKYFVSILVEIEENELPKTDSSIGIDVGLKDFAILSDETAYKNRKFFGVLEKKLAKEKHNVFYQEGRKALLIGINNALRLHDFMKRLLTQEQTTCIKSLLKSSTTMM